MKKYKFIGVVLSVIILVIAADLFLGYLSNLYTKKHEYPGDYLKIEYLMKKANEDIIILGSSVGINSYIPQMIEDSLGLTCFNGGCNAQQIPFFYCMAEAILHHHTPRYIILALRHFELVESDMGRINLLNPYYRRGYKSIDEALESQNKREKYLLQSNLYRYNTIWWRIMLYYVKSFDELGHKGFVGKEVPAFYPKFIPETGEIKPVSKSKIEYFRNIAELCKDAGIGLIVAIPPVYMKTNNNSEEVICMKKLCKEYDIPLIDNNQSEPFITHPELFHDNEHLNVNGARIMTSMFIEELKPYIKK